MKISKNILQICFLKIYVGFICSSIFCSPFDIYFLTISETLLKDLVYNIVYIEFLAERTHYRLAFAVIMCTTPNNRNAYCVLKSISVSWGENIGFYVVLVRLLLDIFPVLIHCCILFLNITDCKGVNLFLIFFPDPISITISTIQ